MSSLNSNVCERYQRAFAFVLNVLTFRSLLQPHASNQRHDLGPTQQALQSLAGICRFSEFDPAGLALSLGGPRDGEEGMRRSEVPAGRPDLLAPIA